jgi:cell division septal protein FtsQ
MRKKKEFPRKRKRVVKKIILLSMILFTTLLSCAGGSYYYFVLRTQKSHAVLGQQAVRPTQSELSDKIYNELQTGLEKDQITYTSLTKENDSYILTLQDGGKVTFSSQKDIMTQIASLQYILSHLTMEGRQFSSLDLRFDQPVIVIK